MAKEQLKSIYMILLDNHLRLLELLHDDIKDKDDINDKDDILEHVDIQDHVNN